MKSCSVTVVYTCVCIQLMGLPSYCDVVTITEKVSRMTLEMHQCRRNTVSETGGRRVVVVEGQNDDTNKSR